VGLFGRAPQRTLETLEPEIVTVRLAMEPKITISLESHDANGWVIRLQNNGKSPVQLQLDSVSVHGYPTSLKHCELELHYLSETSANPGQGILLLLKLTDGQGAPIKYPVQLELWHRSVADSDSNSLEAPDYHELWLELPE
jgi:hypothetical protein